MSSSPPAEPAAGSRGRLLHPSRWTLRSRMVSGLILLVAVVALAIGAVTTVALRGVLIRQLDDQLSTFSHSLPNLPGRSPDGDGQTYTNQQRPQQPNPPLTAHRQDGALVNVTLGDYAVQLTDEQEHILLALPADGHPHTRTLGTLTVLIPDPGATTVTASTVDGGDYRLQVTAPASGGPQQLAGLSLHQAEQTISSVILIELALTVAALILAGIVGAVIVRRALRPLNRVVATARRVSALPLESGEVALSVRVPDADPHTEVGQVGSAINRMLGHVERALAVRHASEQRVRQFVADASHELRTPLAAIRGYAELTRRVRDEVPPDVTHAIGRVESEAARMTTLVEDLLLLARLDSGRPLTREPVELSRLIVDAVGDAHIADPSHDYVLDLPAEEVAVPGDEQRLHQVLANLLANARTHTPPGTKVTVTLATTRESAVLTVRDNGPGIPPALLPDIFQRFTRADTSRSRAAGSTGLGLSIVDAVVTAHGGRVSVESNPGATVFTVRLPLS